MAFQRPPEADETPKNEPKGKVNPLLDEPVISNPNVSAGFDPNKNYSGSDIPEQGFVHPTGDNSNASTKQQEPNKDTNTSQKTAEKKPQQSFNGEMNDLSKKEKNLAAANMAMAVIAGYEWAHQFPKNWIQISDKTVLQLQKKNEISLNTIVDYNNGQPLTVRGAIKEYNDLDDNAFSVSDEFKEEVTPVLTRILEKEGVGMTDKSLVLYLFGKDLVTKIIALNGMIAKRNEFVEVLKSRSKPEQPKPAQPQQQPQQANDTQAQSAQQSQSQPEKVTPTVEVVEPTKDEKPKEKKKRNVYKDSVTDIDFVETK